MEKRILILYVLFGVLFVTLIVIGSRDFSLNLFAVLDEEEIFTPHLIEGEEIEYQGYKYSNNSGVIITTEPRITCEWKSDGEDDGWKKCEAIFEVENLGKEKVKLKNPDLKFDFFDGENIRNIEISYSTKYDLVDDEIIEREKVEEKSDIDGKKIGKGIGLTGFVVSEDIKENRIEVIKDRIELKKTVRKKRDFNSFNSIESNIEVVEENALVDGSINEEPDEILTVNETNETNIIYETNETDSSSNETLNESFIENRTNETNEGETETNNTNETVGRTLFSANVVKEYDSNGIEINTKKPFAIKINFEIPKYEINQFNFEIRNDDFFGYIDPDVSSCGTLDTENGIYTLTQNVESMGACFSVTANNVTIDCQGNSIRYNSVGSPAYGIYSTANSTKIRDCLFISGDLNGKSGAGIYLLNSENAEVYDSTFTLDDSNQEGIYISNGDNAIVQGNEIVISASSTNGVYYSNSDNVSLINNSFTSSGSTEFMTYVDTSDLGRIVNNSYSSGGFMGYSLYLTTSDDHEINGNTIYLNGSSVPAIFFYESDRNYLLNNSVNATGSDTYGLYLESGSDDNIVGNLDIYTSNDWSYGLLLSSEMSGNLFDDIFIETIGYASDAIYLMDVDNNFSMYNSTLITLSDSSADFFIPEDITSGIWNFTNTSLGLVNWSLGSEGNLNIAWYLDVYVNYTNSSSAGGVNVSIRDKEGNLNYLGITNSLGNIDRIELLEYTQTEQNVNVYYSNYSIYVTDQEGFVNVTGSINMTENKNLVLTLPEILDIIPPEINILSPENISYSQSDLPILINLTQNENGSAWYSLNQGVGNVTLYSPDGFNFNGSIVDLNSGSYTLEIFGNDSLDNVNDSESISFSFVSSSVSSSGSGSGGGSGSSIENKSSNSCEDDWSCSDWSECINGVKSRSCVNSDLDCLEGKPTEETKCNPKKRKVLFDINLDLLNNYVLLGNPLLGSVTLINVGEPGVVFANVNYKIKDMDDETIFEETESVEVETQLEYIKEIKIDGLDKGNYKISVDLTYEGQLEPAQSESIFSITDDINDLIYDSSWISLILLFLSISSIVMFLVFRYKIFSKN